MNDFNNLSSEDSEYVCNLPYHLAAAKMAEDLCELLTEFEFLEYKVGNLEPQLLIDDYDLALQDGIMITDERKYRLELIQGAIQLSANILTEDKTQLAGQLLGRLLGYDTLEMALLYLWL